MVEQRKSVGVIVFREAAERLYLLLHYEAGHWDFPKGGVEEGENEEITMRRELKEETGISELTVAPNFKNEIAYFFREAGNLIRKTVVFYLGKTSQKDVRLSFEHEGFEWLTSEQAKERLTYKNAKELLEKAEAFLSQGR